MRFSTLLFTVAVVATPATAQAQGPWVGSVIPGAGAPGAASFMLASAQVVWGSYITPGRLIDCTVFCSVNSGQSFLQQRVITSSPDNRIDDIWGLDGLRAWAIRTRGTAPSLLLATTTGPAGFSVVASAPSARLQFVRFLNATTGILVARPEANATTWPLFRTDDGGATWVTSTTPTPVAGDYPLTCTQVGNTFWVSTYLGYVLRSTDEGRTWTSADTGLGTSLREVSFRSVLNGLAFGDAGQLRRTSDGGQNWIMVTPQGPLRLTKATAVEGSAGTYLSVAGEWNSAQNGTSISTDDGATWVEVESSINMQRLVSREGVVYGTGFPFGNNTTMTLYKYASPLSTRARQQERASFCFPNPTADVINLPAASETRTVRLYDAVGRLHRTWELDRAENVLHLDGVALGVYQLHLFEQNKAIRVQQIVVQR